MLSDDDKFLLLAKKIKSLQEQVAQKGDRGEQGEQGPQGLPGPAGRNGKDGLNGRDGSDGRDGVDGLNGKDGKDGISVIDAQVDFDGSLVIKLSDGSELDVGKVTGDSSDKGMTVLQQTSGQKVYVQSTAPDNPQPNDIWYQI